MRLRFLEHETTPAGASEPLIGGRSPEDALLGSWSATRWQYASRAHPGHTVDVVCDLGGSVTLSLSAGTYVLTWAIAGQGSSSVGGSLSVLADRIALLAEGSSRPESLVYRLATETLALSSDTSSWDFNGGGEEPAEFVAVLVRL